MEQLLSETLNHNIAPAYVNRLLEAFSPKDAERTDRLRTEDLESDHIEPLTMRELEVLRLLKTGLSGPEIAQELVIALSTYQSHTKSIYSKLAVNNRRAAVIKAEDLNIL